MTPTTGSINRSKDEDTLVGSMDFYGEGGVNVFMADTSSMDEEVVESFRMTTEFIFHALTRSDWMTEFFINFYENLEASETQNSKNSLPVLTLIKGGKDEGPD
jgi:hypothetical protein